MYMINWKISVVLYYLSENFLGLFCDDVEWLGKPVFFVWQVYLEERAVLEAPACQA